MAEAAPPPPAAAALRRELDFVKSLLKSGRSIDEMMAAANAAARVAARAVEETKRSMHKGGTELTIRGLPTGGDWDWRAFKRWLQSRGLSQRAIKYTEKDVEHDVGVVRFATEADCSAAADMLPTCEPPVRGATITVERGLATELLTKPRKRGREGDEEAPPQGGRGPKVPRVPDVCEAVCPWWKVPYGKQLTDKHHRIVEAMAQITVEVDRRTYGASKPEWIRIARSGANSLPPANRPGDEAVNNLCCPLLGILRSPVLERYRNKSEFTAGLDEHEKANVGFLRGAFQDGVTCVGSPEATRHTSLAAVKLAAAAAAYIRDTSEFAVYDKRRQEGYWRLLVVREGSGKSFLPVPLSAAAAAGGAEQQVLDSPTFTSLDAFTYLITFGQEPGKEEAGKEEAGAAPAAAAEAAPAAAAAAEAPAAADAPAAAAAAPVDVPMELGEAAAVPAEGATASAPAAAAATAAPGSGSGVHVSEVSEGEPERPPPDEVLVMVQVNPNYTRALAEPATTARELRAMTACLAAAAAAAGLPLTTVRVQNHTGVSNAAPADAPMIEVPAAAPAAEGSPEEDPAVATAVAASAGPGYIHDSLCELKFRISPTAFFQVNSAATCALYKVVGDWAAPRPSSTLLLDICCGTGTIGLTMAGRVAKVVGVDSVASAVEDARVNATLNNITNAEFVAGKAEDALPGILAAHAGSSAYDDVVAVADPPRAGLHKSVLRALLGCAKIRRLVFVSCNPDNLVQNVAALCSPPESRGDRFGGGRGGRGRGRFGTRDSGASEPVASYTPFRPVKALAVDLFPHTAHVEAVMLLER